MNDDPISFSLLDAHAEPYAAQPTILFDLQLEAAPHLAVHSIALRAQVRIEPQRRRYTSEEEDRLVELFGETPRWGSTLKPFLWTHLATSVTGFTGTTVTQLPMVCTYDFDITATKYLHALGTEGVIPLIFLFSGTMFVQERTEDGIGPVAALPLPWHEEGHYQLPVRVWRDMMDMYFPGGGWLRLDRETIDALGRFRVEQALPTWDQAIQVLLKEAGA